MARFKACTAHARCIFRMRRGNPDARMHLRVAQVCLRENCANFFHCHGAYDVRFRTCALPKRKPATMPPRVDGVRSNPGLRLQSVIFVFQQFGIGVRIKKLIELIGVIDRHGEQPTVAIGIFIDCFRLV